MGKLQSERSVAMSERCHSRAICYQIEWTAVRKNVRLSMWGYGLLITSRSKLTAVFASGTGHWLGGGGYKMAGLKHPPLCQNVIIYWLPVYIQGGRELGKKVKPCKMLHMGKESPDCIKVKPHSCVCVWTSSFIMMKREKMETSRVWNIRYVAPPAVINDWSLRGDVKIPHRRMTETCWETLMTGSWNHKRPFLPSVRGIGLLCNA